MLYNPRPLLVLVAGKPGAGKSTLAQELARPQYLGLPLLARDAIKVGLVETYAFPRRGVARIDVETDTLRSTLVPRSFDLFYETIGQWLQKGVSLIAESGFDQRSEPMLRSIIPLAKPVLIQCEAADDEARRRFIEREQADPRHRPDRLAATIERIEAGTDPWTQFVALEIPVPTLRVDTNCGYNPSLVEVSAFCRDVAARSVWPPGD